MKSASLKVSDLAKEWMKDPAFKVEYDALEEEFSLAAALIRANSASMTQEQRAAAMGTKLRIGFVR
jgi:hypothetical protein